MSNVISAVNERNFVAQTVGVRPATLSPSYLRSGVALGNGNNYTWKFTKTGKQTGVLPTDYLLDQSDRFVVTGISFALTQINSDTPSNTQYSVAILYQFYNPKVFTQTNDANLQALYNGYARITLDESIIVPNIHMRNFERVGDTQQGNVTAVYYNSGATTYSAGRDSLPYGTYGEMPVTPFVIAGDSKFQIDVILGETVNMDTSSYTNNGIFLLRGYKAAATL